MGQTRKLQVRKTLLVSGEGIADINFLNYLKQLYFKSDSFCAVTVHKKYKKAGAGGSTCDVVCEAMKASINNNRHFDAIVIMADRDIAPNSTDKILYAQAKAKLPKKARSQVPEQYKFLYLNPCLEGLYMEILAQNRCATAQECKERFKQFSGKEAHKMALYDFERHFPKRLLDKMRKSVQSLDGLISVFELNSRQKFRDFINSPSSALKTRHNTIWKRAKVV